ncbi:Protein RIC-3 [Labeo rohita]|uniref:Protein RIC-3 n=1 Tax=Labeo rohita TaxID=84645 RepID=A0ABQ8L356_LABRO|nr:Protein RIC-3 [Labeo rohita]
MTISTFQKLTIVSCVVLCVALLLPKMLLSRGKRDTPHTEGPAGHFPPMPHRPPASEEQRRSGRHFSRAHNTEAIARAKGAGAGASAGGKSNLAGQIIPIYGFGILLYILYILFKITSKGKTAKPPESRFTAVRSENMKRKISMNMSHLYVDLCLCALSNACPVSLSADFELAQLQDRLNETKDVIERIISAASADSDSDGGAVAVDEEQKLLYQLQEITRVMQEGRYVDAVPANTDDSCGREWDDLPEKEPNEHFCCVHSPHMSSDAQMRERDAHETSPDISRPDEESVSDHDEKTDANRNTKMEDIACDSTSQSQPETETQTGSDITPSPVSEHSIIRRRNKQ